MTIPLQKYVTQFLDERHRLGFQSRSMGHALRGLAAFVENLALAGPLTREVMAQWARQPSNDSVDPKTWARRLKILRPFTRWLRQFEPDTDIPDEAIFGSVGERMTPHIYSEQEIVDLLAAARQLQPSRRGATDETLFGLLAATGLRLSEAVHLCQGDVDLKHGVLTVRQTKFAKSRQVPVHPTTLAALRRYREQCDRDLTAMEESPLFVGSRDRRHAHRPSPRQVDRIFQQLREQLGWVNRGAHAAPRLHDLRHTFVVRRILLWQAQGVDIDQRRLALSTYVGHAHVTDTDTDWSLSAVPELMAVAAECFEAGQPAAEVACD